MSEAKNHKELQQKIEDRFGQSVDSKARCEDLRISILSTINQPVGLNTLRRFFGLIDYKASFSKTILDLLSKYVGYVNYESFLENETSVNGASNHFILNQLVDSNGPEVDSFFKNLSVKTFLALEKIILLNASNLAKVQSLLIGFYDNELIWNESAFYHSRYHVSQVISGLLTNESKQVQQNILNQIVLAKFGKEYFHLFPPMDYHEGNAWDCFIDFYEVESEQERMFKKSILALGAFKRKDWNAFIICLESINRKPSLKVHSLLFSRMLSLDILEAELFEKRLDVSNLVKLTKEKFRSLNEDSLNFGLEVQFTVIYILHAFVLTSRLEQLVRFIEELDLKEFLVSDYWTSNVNNHIKIYFSIYHKLKGNSKLAENIIDSVNPDVFPVFERKAQLHVYNVAKTLKVE